MTFKGDAEGERRWREVVCVCIYVHEVCVCACRNVLLKALHTKAAQAPFAPQRPVEEVVAVEEKKDVSWSVGGQFPSLTGMNGMEQ